MDVLDTVIGDIRVMCAAGFKRRWPGVNPDLSVVPGDIVIEYLADDGRPGWFIIDQSQRDALADAIRSP